MIERNQPRYHNIHDYPIMLTAEDVAEILCISRTNAYAVMRMSGFPTIHRGKRMVVPRDRLIKWIDEQLGAN